MNQHTIRFLQYQQAALEIEHEKWRRISIQAKAKLTECSNRMAEIDDLFAMNIEMEKLVHAQKLYSDN